MAAQYLTAKWAATDIQLYVVITAAQYLAAKWAATGIQL